MMEQVSFNDNDNDNDAVGTVGIVGTSGLGPTGESLAGLLRAAGIAVVPVDLGADLDVVPGRAGAALAGADVIVETAPERVDLKCGLLRAVAAVSGSETVLVTTAAAQSVTRIAIGSGRPDRVVGLTVLAPPQAGRRMAVTRTAMASVRATRTVERLLASLDIAELEIDGRALSRVEELVFAFLNRAVAMCAEGHATVEEIDTAMRLGCRLPAGPLELLDQLGLDTVHERLADLRRGTGNRTHDPAALLTELVRSGEHGRRTGRGFYHYTGADAPRRDGDGRRTRGPAGPEVTAVGVVGSGTMARGIAETTATVGYPTVLVARDQYRADAALDAVEASTLRAVRRGVITPDVRDRAIGRLRADTDMVGLRKCDLVIEAVAEDLDVKRAVFGDLDRTCPPWAVLATTTSSLPVVECANATARPAEVLGLHFFNPAPAMHLVELVHTEHTGAAALKIARLFCTSLGKTVVECRDRCGLIVNSLLFPYLNDAVRLLEDGAAGILEIDTGIEQGFGFPLGPFALMDTIGLDVCLDILHSLHRAFPTVTAPPSPLLAELVVAGRLGRKTAGGFRTYERRTTW